MYEGQRDTFSLTGQYNLDLDTRIVYGLEHEVDAAEIPSNYHTGQVVHTLQLNMFCR